MLKTKHFLLSLCLVTVACSSNDGVSYPDGLPDTMKHQPNDGSLPEAMMKVDSANVCITLLGREIHQGEQFNVTLFSIADCNELSPVTLPSDGKVSLNLSLQGSTMLSMGLNDFEERLPPAWIAPGEDIDIYIDCRPDSLRTPGAATIYTTGTYSDLNGLMSTHYPLAHSISIFNAPDNAYAMTGDEYTAVILKAYNDSLNAINSDQSTPEMIRELQKITLKTDMAAMVTQLPIIIRYGIISASETPDSTRLRLSDTNIANIVKSVGFDEPKLFMASGHPFAMSIENVDWASNGAAGTPLGDAGVYQKIARKASAGRLSDEDRNTVNNLRSPFYGDAVNAIDKEYQAKLKESMDIIQKVPDVSPEKIIEAIVAPHKGKVVMIDMWNTWCSPCRAAIAENEPFKSGELADDDIVWIYLADESSPLNLYVGLIPDIKGLHYRLSAEQAEAISKRFGIDGIPYYIFVTRDGKIEGRPDLRDHDLFKKTIIEEVNRK